MVFLKKNAVVPFILKNHMRIVIAASLMGFLGVSPSWGLSGNVTYSINKVLNPTTDQTDAYAKIKIAMDSATSFYNTYATITKRLSISYNTSVATADGNINGSIRFGRNRSYMICCTAMHEIAHTVGVGTCGAWPKLIINGQYTGKNAINEFRTITGNPNAILKGDSQHFWPYGLNYAGEAASNAEYVNHTRIVNAMQKDFYPSEVVANLVDQVPENPTVTMNSMGVITYRIPASCFVELRLLTLSGRTVAVLKLGRMRAGERVINIAPSILPSDFYVCRLTAGEHGNGADGFSAAFSGMIAK